MGSTKFSDALEKLGMGRRKKELKMTSALERLHQRKIDKKEIVVPSVDVYQGASATKYIMDETGTWQTQTAAQLKFEEQMMKQREQMLKDFAKQMAQWQQGTVSYIDPSLVQTQPLVYYPDIDVPKKKPKKEKPLKGKWAVDKKLL